MLAEVNDCFRQTSQPVLFDRAASLSLTIHCILTRRVLLAKPILKLTNRSGVELTQFINGTPARRLSNALKPSTGDY